MSIRVRLAASLAVLLLAASCGGGGSDDTASAETTAPGTSTSSETTESGDEATTSEVETTTTVPLPTGPTAPLTGLVVDEVKDRPALAVKIDNHEFARPQTGINQADLVYEERVEGISRFVAVFQSTDSDPVGPIRSARTTDVRLIAHLSMPLFANSGGNAGTLRQVNNSPNLINMNVNKAPSEYFRDSSNARAPHNLFSNTSALLARAPEGASAPGPLFEYREPGTDLSEYPKVSSVAIDIGHSVSYDWDAELQGWARTQNGTPHVDSEGVRVAPANVIVMETNYGVSAADPTSPEAIVTGTGIVWVFTEGIVIEGTWVRNEITDVARLLDENGDDIELTPGRTWVALPKPGRTTITAGN